MEERWTARRWMRAYDRLLDWQEMEAEARDDAEAERDGKKIQMVSGDEFLRQMGVEV